MSADTDLRHALIEAFRRVPLQIGREDAAPLDEDLGILADAALAVIRDWTVELPLPDDLTLDAESIHQRRSLDKI